MSDFFCTEEKIVSANHNEWDVAGKVKTTDPVAVHEEVERIYIELYDQTLPSGIHTAFADLARMYAGQSEGLFPCDTAYHDIQHVLDVTLAMARLIDGYERGRQGTEAMGERLFQLGVITALFHDIGYLRKCDEVQVTNGAEFTLVHVSRGAQFLREYFPRLGLPEFGDIAACLIHFTGFEIPVAAIKVPGLKYRLLGNLLGSADIIAQMADRCYLEKCRDRLYPEFVSGGLTRAKRPDGEVAIVYASGEDLVRKTPGFYAGASKRLIEDLGGGYAYAETHFRGQNLYLDEVNKNIDFARALEGEPDLSALKRTPPETLVD